MALWISYQKWNIEVIFNREKDDIFSRSWGKGKGDAREELTIASLSTVAVEIKIFGGVFCGLIKCEAHNQILIPKRKPVIVILLVDAGIINLTCSYISFLDIR